MAAIDVKQLVSRIDASRDAQFWALQTVGWLGLAFLTYFSLTVQFNATNLPHVLHPFVQSAIGMVVSWPMRGVFRSFWEKDFGIRLVSVISTALILSVVWTLLRLVSFVWMSGEQKDFTAEFGAWYYPGALIFLAWAGLYHGIKYYQLLQEEHEALLHVAAERNAEELRRTQAESDAREAQLKMLRYQLNPHFLFNTLNSVVSLISGQRFDDARSMIIQLSEFLRKSLDNDPLQAISLREEVETLRLYLRIEQERFVDRLRLEFDISEEALNMRVPSLILQPLAENAIKHGMAKKIDSGTIRVSAAVANGTLRLAIEDDGPGMKDLEDIPFATYGVGLRNTRERLNSLYGDKASMSLEQLDPSGLRVMLELPVNA